MHPLPPTHSKYHPPSCNTHTPTILQHSHTKGTPCSPAPTPNPQEVPPTILQHSYTKGTPCPHPLPPTHRKYHPPSHNTHTLKGPPPPPLSPQPTGSTTHHLTTLIHPQSYNTHTLKGPITPHPLPPTQRKNHPPSYNTHTPTPTPSECVYYNFVLDLITIPRNVYQDSQRAMLTYCHPVNLCTIN